MQRSGQAGVRLATAVLLVASVGCAGPARNDGTGATGGVLGLVPDLVLDGVELYQPSSVAFGPEGDLYVLDVGNYRLFRYSADGELLEEIGRQGEGVGEFPFFTYSDGHVLYADGKLLVVMARARRVNVWDLKSGSTRSFTIDTFAVSAGFDGGSLHVGTSSRSSGPGDPLVRVYSLEGDLVDSYGEHWQPDWHGEMAEPVRGLYRQTRIGMAPTGRVYDAMTMWPRVRAFEDGELLWDNWYDMAWLKGDPVYGDALYDLWHRPRSMAENLTAEEIVPEGECCTLMATDLAASTDALVVLLGGSHLQLYAPDGTPGPNYELLRPGETIRTRRAGPPATALAVNADGSRVCVAAMIEAQVLCYGLPEAAGRP